MKIIIEKLKKTDIKDACKIYTNVIDSSYISYGEIREGLAEI